ncbi:MAG: hypothetical protein CSA81_08845 [Acidobacteria bacterium]|nr:MAG: hypothetical protein CSA81_08845 [Acidobacteriota bacterium]
MRTFLFVLCLSPFIVAEEPARNWKNSTELAFLATGGNSETATFGLKNHYTLTKGKGTFNFKLEGIRTSDTETYRTAVGTADDFSILETEETNTKVERYTVDLKYDRKISDALEWFVGTKWEKDAPKGIKSRLSFMAGLGNILISRDDMEWKINYGLEYSTREHYVEPEGFDSSFGSVAFSSVLMKKFGKNSKWDQNFDITAPFEDFEAYRVNFTNSLTSSLAGNFAMKLSLALMYEGTPAFSSVALFDTVGGNELGTVLYEKDNLDYSLTASLVMNF